MESSIMHETIRQQLKQKNAILLAHNYQPPEIQDVADMCGDSLELSIRAGKTDADIIVFCGVHFMAETASIVSPQKTVLLPKTDAGCPMADMITPEDLIEKKKTLPGVPVVTYVNSPASVKALSDICCTSANAVKVVNSLPDQSVLMTPDKNLAHYTSRHTSKKIHFWDGYCPIHHHLLPEMLAETKDKHPHAIVLAHPECRSEILDMADAILSTSGMLKYVADATAQLFIIATEYGLIYPLKKNNPNKEFISASHILKCPDMKKITLPDIIETLDTLSPEIRVPDDIQRAAREAVERMIAIL
ncbi:MAG: quinolinate synthase [Candidatus Magnetoglobus multicellularis str. Araruama]|uniref:Quinolinate synthase n=1 Tax=Candidatus Magnetoglobus multicellularis str. Araruama TaxID=890399 RepID=A0A1V1PBK8_9BACT|nr:MAG: quinolinate synthase [Candidatus Magnetoglobus multicellularis str. Araruama]